MKNNKLEDVAKLIVQLASKFGLELTLALDDYAGPQHYLYFFEQPCSTRIRDFLLAKRFTQRHQPRTPHDAEAEIFINDDLSARIWFSDPAKILISNFGRGSCQIPIHFALFRKLPGAPEAHFNAKRIQTCPT
jgi:hypothetical protein